MKVLIEGAGTINKGAEAMLRTVRSQLGPRLDGAAFAVEAGTLRHPVVPGEMEELGIEILSAWYPAGRIDWAMRLSGLALRRPLGVASGRSRRAALRWDGVLDAVDLVVDISGLAYSDDMNPFRARRTAPLIRRARQRGIPYVLLPQAFGPFRPGSPMESICRDSLREAALLFARDRASRRHVADLLGVPEEMIPLAPDIAFLFDPSGENRGRELLAGLGLGDSGRPIVGLSPNMRVYERIRGTEADHPYAAMLIGVARRFLAEGIDVLLLPHEINHSAGGIDDRFLCELIRTGAAGAAGDAKIAAVTRAMTAPDLKALIARCSLLVGSRYHAIVAALSSCVPVAALGWSHKYVELLGDLGMGDFVIDYREVDAPSMLRMVGQAWSDRDATRRHLLDVIPQARSSAGRVFDTVASAACRGRQLAMGGLTPAPDAARATRGTYAVGSLDRSAGA